MSEETQDYAPEIIDTAPQVDTPSPISEDALRNAIPDEEKPSASIDEAIEKAMAKAQGKDKPEAKADSQSTDKDKEAPEVKQEKADSDGDEEKPKASNRGVDGKFVAPEKDGKAGEDEAAARAQSEGKHVKAPSRLLPSERDVWVNTPRRVQEAFERLEREIDEGATKHKEASDFYEQVKPYAEMAKSANTTVKDALDRYVAADKLLSQDFGRGMAQIAQSHGKNPVEAVAQFMRAANVLPQQLGEYLQRQPVQQQAQQDPARMALQEIQQLKAQLEKRDADMEEMRKQEELESRIRQTHEQLVSPYERQYGEAWADLEPMVAKMLQSDIIDRSLSPELRLREAVYAAERLTSPLQSRPGTEADPDTDSKVTQLPRKKQISGSPVASNHSTVKKGPAPSIDEALAKALRNATR